MSKQIIVIGGGGIGLATAMELARRGARVHLLDKQAPGQEASWAGAGILSLLLPWDYGDPLLRLTARSLELYHQWSARILELGGIDPEYRRSGLFLLPPYAGKATRDWLHTHHIEHRIDQAATTHGLTTTDRGLWLPDVAQVRNPRLLKGLLAVLPKLGVELHADTAVTNLETSEGRVSAVVAGDRCWHADLVVIAAGAWSATLVGDWTPQLPVRPVRGQMLLYQAAPDRLRCIVYRHGLYLVPRADGHILAGSTLEDVGFDKSTTEEAKGLLSEFVAGLLPDVAATGPLRQWAGLRPGSPGNVPIIARHPTWSNLFVNSGHFRYGVTLAPASAELVADLIEGRQPALDPRLFAWPAIIRPAPV